MGRTNQVLTGGSIYSTSPQTTTMKIVLALLVLCLFQFSLAEQEDSDNAETNLVLERDVREAGRKNCNGKNCKKRGKKSRKERKRKKGGKKIQEVQAKLANCSVSAGDNCGEGKLASPIDSTLVSTCKDTLEAFAKAFKVCLTKSSDAEICSCVQGLTNPGDECLDFKTMHDGVKAQKDKCTKGTEA